VVTGNVPALRVGAFNLLSGRSLADGLVDADRLAAEVASLDADVLSLQEVDRGQERSRGHDQAADLAAATGAVSHLYVETVLGTPGVDGWLPAPPGPAGAGPGYGIALLSRRPVASWHVLRLEAGPGRYPIAIPARPPRVLWLRDEPRAVVAAVLEEPRLTVAGTHLSFVPFFNARQLRRVARWLERLPGPRLLVGDLNQGARLVRRTTGWALLVTAPTFPSPAPRLQLDHVLAHGLPDGTRAWGEARELAVSDHRAVLVDLWLPPTPR
jgi:endonuclease/exonuclease/phosphatase family metal-dependent hydrolase